MNSYTIYKPNPKNTGSLASFRVSEQDTSKGTVARLFIEIVPQSGWDAVNKTGSFDNTKKKAIMFNVGEAGNILHSMRTESPFTCYHKSGEVNTSIRFGPWPKEVIVGREGEVGFWKGPKTDYAFSVSSGNERRFVSLSFGEAEVFKLLLEEFVKLHLRLEFENNSKRMVVAK